MSRKTDRGPDEPVPGSKEYARMRADVGRYAEWAVLAFWVLALAVALLFIAAARVGAAPAPRFRPQRVQPSLPIACTMYFGGSPYKTTFAPGGQYTAQLGDCPAWVGSWAVSGRTLIIHETINGETWLTHTINLDRKLREGVIVPADDGLPREGATGTPFRIEEGRRAG